MDRAFTQLTSKKYLSEWIMNIVTVLAKCFFIVLRYMFYVILVSAKKKRPLTFLSHWILLHICDMTAESWNSEDAAITR
jgi:hypothetical protein